MQSKQKMGIACSLTQPDNENFNGINLSTSRSSQEGYEETQIELENRKLRNKVWDLQLKQREYITKILNLETDLARMTLDLSNNQSKKSRPSIETSMGKGIPLFDIKQLERENKSGKSKKKQKEKEQSSVSGEQKKFCQVIKKTYTELFQISSLKQIWKKHKEILAEWLFSEGKENSKNK